VHVNTTLNFFGRTEEAIEFYRVAVDAQLIFLMRFRDSPMRADFSPEVADKVFHATFRIGTTEIMASDVGCQETHFARTFAGFSLAMRVESISLAERFFRALGEGGIVEVPLAQTFFAARYGIVIDRFGLSWKLIVEDSATT
jgi:PhnB protein